jgi:hypothetical protein
MRRMLRVYHCMPLQGDRIDKHAGYQVQVSGDIVAATPTLRLVTDMVERKCPRAEESR